MSDFVKQLARADIAEMVPYQSARREQQLANSDKIWLNANEAGGNGEYRIAGENINRYPDFQPGKLLDAYRNYCKEVYAPIETNQILATRGADEGIDVLIRTFCTAGQDNILICPPTYGMYAISAATQGAGVIKVPLKSNYQLNVDEVIAQKGKVNLVFLCSPNNPTGNLLNKTDIETVIKAFDQSALVVVDEAYIEFCQEQSVANWLAKYPNLVILRTLSKAYALAGLRCGFTLASADVIAMLSKVIAPYPISEPVAELASKSLSADGIAIMQENVTETNSLKQELKSWLKQWGAENPKLCAEVLDSDANFILARSDEAKAQFNFLKDQGILIRDQSSQQALTNCLRYSIGSERELAVLKQALEQFSQSLLNESNKKITTSNPEEVTE